MCFVVGVCSRSIYSLMWRGRECDADKLSSYCSPMPLAFQFVLISKDHVASTKSFGITLRERTIPTIQERNKRAVPRLFVHYSVLLNYNNSLRCLSY